ncbi:MAG: TlpA family protein disulfide reductase [Proteobacteria bacterium]|nr:TlpA family protein disulfide reductase [Pseudomonadota bacterium]
MRRLILLAILMIGAIVVEAVEQGQAAPTWTGMDFSGNEVSFPSVIDGKPTVMIFWATWCPYCNAFMPYLGQIQKDYGEDKINVIAINAKERGIGDPAAYVAKLDFTVIDVAEGDVIAEKYSVNFIPGLMIVDGDGNIAWKRASTELPAGKTVAELWDGQVREQLDLLLAAN